MTSTSETLIRQLRDTSNEVAWGQFVRIYSQPLFNWVRKKGLQYDDSLEVVQKVFQVLVKQLPDYEYDRGKSFRAWLYTITRNVWRDHCRQSARRVPTSADLDGEIGADDVFSESRYQQEVLSQAMRLIQPEYQAKTWEVFVRHGIHGEPAAEVAASLGMTVGAVYAARCRVIARLRNLLHQLLE